MSGFDVRRHVDAIGNATPRTIGPGRVARDDRRLDRVTSVERLG